MPVSNNEFDCKRCRDTGEVSWLRFWKRICPNCHGLPHSFGATGMAKRMCGHLRFALDLQKWLDEGAKGPPPI